MVTWRCLILALKVMLIFFKPNSMNLHTCKCQRISCSISCQSNLLNVFCRSWRNLYNLIYSILVFFKVRSLGEQCNNSRQCTERSPYSTCSVDNVCRCQPSYIRVNNSCLPGKYLKYTWWIPNHCRCIKDATVKS